MRRSTIISSLLLGSSLAVGGFTLTPSFAGETRTVQSGERQWLSIQKILDKLETAGYRDFEEIERERGGYEVRATDRNGERIKLYVNPQTGDITDQRVNGKHAGADDNRRQRGSSFADCNERRCRDDLPSKTTPPASAAK